MCTVSFIATSNEIIITSNRDEQTLRSVALPPNEIEMQFGSLYYPIDTKAGGTWFIVSSLGNVGVLLNGAFEKHIPLSNYKSSRGEILPLIFQEENPLKALQQLDLSGFQQHTIILFVYKNLYQCIWDAEQLHVKELPVSEPHIWSSVTLYSAETIALKKLAFTTFIANTFSINSANIIDFHTQLTLQNKPHLLMPTVQATMQTVSLSSVCISKQYINLYYQDCNTGNTYNNTVPFQTMFNKQF